MGLRLGLKRAIVVQSAEVAKEIFKTKDIIFCNRAPMVGLLKMSYNGLEMAFGPYGESCKQGKKLSIFNLLSPKRIQSAGNIRQEEVSRLMDKIYGISSNSQIVNLSDLLTSYACSNMCRMAFGKSYSSF